MNFLINNDLHVVDKPVKVGELQVWELNNVSLMDHPFSLAWFLLPSTGNQWKSSSL
jgi:FtsP/CotA-like multicopper oxidase with cupredoxin domain